MVDARTSYSEIARPCARSLIWETAVFSTLLGLPRPTVVYAEDAILEEHDWLKYGIIGAAAIGFVVLIMVAVNSGDLEGHTWEVEEMTLHALPVKPIEGTTMTAEFKEGTIGGLATCNTFSGGYTVEGNAMTIGPLATTLMACTNPPGATEQESSYLGLLSTVDAFEVSGDQLTLSSQDIVVLKYKAK
jgi:heat shock protein HslJ